MEATIHLADGETAVVGYGSLLSVQSITKTLGREYDGPFVTCHLEGWRRSWDVSMPNEAFYFLEDGERVYPERILYLNVRPDPGALLNVVVFVANRKELEAMNHREWIYEHPVVTSALRGLRVEGGDAIVYAGRAEHVVRDAVRPRQAAIRSSYLKMIGKALAAVDHGFREEYRRTTDPVPEHLVIADVLDPDRPNPWAAAGHDYRPEK